MDAKAPDQPQSWSGAFSISQRQHTVTVERTAGFGDRSAIKSNGKDTGRVPVTESMTVPGHILLPKIWFVCYTCFVSFTCHAALCGIGPESMND